MIKTKTNSNENKKEKDINIKTALITLTGGVISLGFVLFLPDSIGRIYWTFFFMLNLGFFCFFCRSINWLSVGVIFIIIGIFVIVVFLIYQMFDFIYYIPYIGFLIFGIFLTYEKIKCKDYQMGQNIKKKIAIDEDFTKSWRKLIEMFPELTPYERVEKLALELEIDGIDVASYGFDLTDKKVREDAKKALWFYKKKRFYQKLLERF